MERMGDILARTARIRARRGRLSAAQTPPVAQPADQAPATRPAGASTPQRAAARAPQSPPTTTPTPARRAPVARGAQARPDVTQRAIPPADTLDTERILELPAQRPTVGAARAARVTTPLVYAAPPAPAGPMMRGDTGGAGSQRTERPKSAAQPTSQPSSQPMPQAQRGRSAAARPAAASRIGAGSSRMLSLGEAAKGYADALRTTRGSSAPEALGSAPDGQARRSAGSPRPPVDPDVCPHCHGAGYVRLDVPVGDPAFGQAVACSCKERLLEDRRMSDLRRMSSLDAFRDKTFDTFDISLPGVREALEVARRYAEDPHGWLVLSGGYGVGKTHLAAAIAHERLASGQSVFFSIVPDLLDHLRAAFAPSSEMPYDELFDKVREAGVLVLDDLGAENATAWATEKLFQIINYRYNYRMPTVVTTNNRLLSHMDERIRSRLSDMSFVRNVTIDAADYRERHAGRPRQSRQAGQSGGQRSGRAYSR